MRWLGNASVRREWPPSVCTPGSQSGYSAPTVNASLYMMSKRWRAASVRRRQYALRRPCRRMRRASAPATTERTGAVRPMDWTSRRPGYDAPMRPSAKRGRHAGSPARPASVDGAAVRSVRCGLDAATAVVGTQPLVTFLHNDCGRIILPVQCFGVLKGAEPGHPPRSLFAVMPPIHLTRSGRWKS